jgi:hypothetical protein
VVALLVWASSSPGKFDHRYVGAFEIIALAGLIAWAKGEKF